jgi:hypothetical protein
MRFPQLPSFTFFAEIMFPVGTVAHSRGQDIPVLKLPADIEDRTGKGLIRALVLPQPLDDLSL